jgi:membrane protein implicated in regulation of membrane protease activity
MSELFGDGNGWLICGLVFIIVEMLMNLGYVSISFGVGSLLTGLLIKIDSLPTTFDTGFVDELFVAAVLSFCALILIRGFFKVRSLNDINNY